jgi:hypothetical protein
LNKMCTFLYVRISIDVGYYNIKSYEVIHFRPRPIPLLTFLRWVWCILLREDKWVIVFPSNATNTTQTPVIPTITLEHTAHNLKQQKTTDTTR